MLFPQINLAAVISKDDDSSHFQNELFRNIDFLITDSEFKPLIFIEINDSSHNSNQRKERDQKVHNICEEAGIPIITLWTSYGVNKEYIKEKNRYYSFGITYKKNCSQQAYRKQSKNSEKFRWLLCCNLCIWLI